MKPLRPPSRGMLRRAAMAAFLNYRKAPRVALLRPPMVGEVPLSDEEIRHGIEHGLIVQPLNEAGPRGEAWL